MTLEASVLTRLAAESDLRSQIAACTACSLHSSSSKRVPWSGPPGPVALIGEAPGYHEDLTGVPFVGPAGQLLDRILDMIGVPRFRLPAVNVICCRPPANNFDVARKVGAVESCDRWFHSQLTALDAWCLVLLGNSALSKFVQGSIGSYRGKPFWHPWGYYLIPTYHPSYALRNPEIKGVIARDLADLPDIMAGLHDAPLPPRYDPSVALLRVRGTADQLHGLAEHYRKRRWVLIKSRFLPDQIVVTPAPTEKLPAKVRHYPQFSVPEILKLPRNPDRFAAEVLPLYTVKAEITAEIGR